MNAYDIAKDLDREGKFPGHVCYGTSPLLVRAANKLRKQADRIRELEEGLEKIIEGCRNVKTDDELNKHAKELATLVIKDCNMMLGKIYK